MATQLCRQETRKQANIHKSPKMTTIKQETTQAQVHNQSSKHLQHLFEKLNQAFPLCQDGIGEDLWIHYNNHKQNNI